MTRSILKILLLAALLFHFPDNPGCYAASSDNMDPAIPRIRRAAFDIGSGTMKLKVDDVVAEPGSAPTFHPVKGGDRFIRVDFEARLREAADGRFPLSVMREGVVAAARLKTIAERLGAVEFNGVATGAFRTSANGPALVRIISKTTGIRLSIASKRDEAELAFLAAKRSGGISPERLVVWDIGAATMTFTAKDDNGKIRVYQSDLASIGLRNYITRVIQGKSPGITSPNPMNGDQVKKALRYVREQAARMLPAGFREKLTAPSTVIVGVGPVHYLSVRHQMRLGQRYTPDAVAQALDDSVGLSDDEIGGRFADTDTPNLILVLGFMRELGIKKLTPMDVNLADGLLAAVERW